MLSSGPISYEIVNDQATKARVLHAYLPDGYNSGCVGVIAQLSLASSIE